MAVADTLVIRFVTTLSIVVMVHHAADDGQRGAVGGLGHGR